MKRISSISTSLLFLFILVLSVYPVDAQQVGRSSASLTVPAQNAAEGSPASRPSELKEPVEASSENMETPEAPMPAAEQAGEADALSEFEQFISGGITAGISTNIRQFGYDLFSLPSSSFQAATKVPVGPGYIIGPGDEVRITVWGKIEGDWTLKVDRDGNISLPKAGVMGVAGLTFSETRDFIQRELKKYYTGFNMNMSMGALRTINVYLVGNAKRPGAYTLSSLSTLVNALIETGGPSKVGTMRDIHLKRNGKTIAHFDMYEFLLKGDKSADVRLMPEDVIFIPQVGPLVGIAGNVRKPAIYEQRGESRLLDLIEMAGGLNSMAYKGRVQRKRIEGHKFITLYDGDILDIEMNEQKNFPLKDGDLIKIFSVVEANNTISLSGAVVSTGSFAIAPGTTRLKDVLEKAGGLRYYASNRVELTRIIVSPSGPSTKVYNLDISKAMKGDPEHNLPLEINDFLFVRSIPEWSMYKTVTVSGEVLYPGTYAIRKGERLSSVIERAGGYTGKAYLRGAVFQRGSVRALQQKSINEMVQRLERDLLAEGSMQVSTALSQEEIEAKKLELEHRQKFIASLRGVKATGRMMIRLAHLRLLKNSEFDISLMEGDSLFIPEKSSTVNVVGSVMSQGSFIYSNKLNFKDYIEMSGGFSRYADEKNVYILKVDGTARRVKGKGVAWNSSKDRWELEAFKNAKGLEPGDSIVIPEKLDRIAWLREIKDISQILYQIAVTAGVAVAVL